MEVDAGMEQAPLVSSPGAEDDTEVLIQAMDRVLSRSAAGESVSETDMPPPLETLSGATSEGETGDTSSDVCIARCHCCRAAIAQFPWN